MTTGAELAAALVDDLNATAFSLPFTAVRAYLPRFDLGEMDSLHVTVVVAGRTLQPASRTLLQVDYRIDIAVQQRLAGDDVAACDPLLRVVAEIADHLAGHRLSAVPAATWIRTEHDPLIDATHLNEWRQFTSLLSVTYRTWEP